MGEEEITATGLMQRLRGAEHRVEVTDPAAARRAAWRRAIDAARREGLVPPGRQLRHTGRDRGELTIWLEDTTNSAPPRPEPLAVPDTVVDVHPLLGAADELAEHLNVDAASVPRALRLLQTLIEAAESRGYCVGWASTPSTLALEREEHVETVHCREEYEDREVVPTVVDLGDNAPRYPWQRVQTQRRSVPAGRLCLELAVEHPSRRGRRARWADRTRWRLEDKLANVLAEIDRRTDDAITHRQAEEENARHREQQWRQAMDTARRAIEHQRRADALRAQVEAWTSAQQVRAYADALADASAGGVHPRGRQEVDAWVAWARSYADGLDPIIAGQLAPDQREPTAEQLRPHLRGWSPHGPDHR